MSKPTDEDLRLAAEALISLQDHYGFQIVMRHMEEAVQHDQQQLSEVDPTDTKQIIALQQNIKGLNWLKETMQVLIRQGLQPELLDEMDTAYPDA